MSWFKNKPTGGEGGPQYIGGDPSQGRYAMASDPGAPEEPPPSTTGKSYYETNNWTGATTDPRGGGGQGEPPQQGGWGRGRGFGR